MRNLTPDQMAELEMLRVEAKGQLIPFAIVEFARSANTALHSAFTWDDTEAAERWRLNQARQVIRAAVVLLPNPKGGAMVPVRAYIHEAETKSYSATVEVLGDEQRAQQLMRQLAADLQRVVARYKRFQELAPQIEALQAVMPGQAA